VEAADGAAVPGRIAEAFPGEGLVGGNVEDDPGETRKTRIWFRGEPANLSKV
jgi:hypothetical protein